jgi:FMN-dependent NADH-azoreductase
MPTLLHIDSSPRYAQSMSRRLSGEAASLWAQQFAGGAVIYRDLARQPVPPVDEPWIIAANTPDTKRTAPMRDALTLSEQLVGELEQAHYYLLAVPMYNFNVPSSFKAYLDQVIRINRTFYFKNGAFHGTLGAKKALVITARGGYYQQGGLVEHDYQEPYLRYALAFMGLTDVAFVHAEGLTMSHEACEAGLERARREIEIAVAHWRG